MAGLLACPICRSNLERFPEAERRALDKCPDCGAGLSQFIELKQHAEQYRDQARDCLARGDIAQACLLLDALSRLVSPAELPLAALHCRLALALEDFDGAELHLEHVQGAEQELLGRQLAEGRARRQLALEQYNYALTCARNANFREAQAHIRQAAGLAPGLDAAWQLKLKIDLKARDYPACYEDLQQLDRLGGRPWEFARLESILPPV